MACAQCAQRQAARSLDADFETRLGDLDFELAGETGARIGDVDLESPWGFEQSDFEIIGADTRVQVSNTTEAPFRYICNLEYDIPGVGRRSICTGTLIGPRTVLTAGHCLSGLQPGRMRVIPGRNGTLEPLPATQATRFILPVGFASSSPTDYGIIHLADPIGNQVGYWSRTYTRWPHDATGMSILASGTLPLPTGQLQVNLSGYPADKPGDARYFCRDPLRPENRCRHSLLSDPRRSPLCGTQQFRAYDLTVTLQGGVLHYLNDTCPGHSGSPVWVRRHPSMGGRVLVAIHVSGDDAIGTKANRAVFINATVRAFIQGNTV